MSPPLGEAEYATIRSDLEHHAVSITELNKLRAEDRKSFERLDRWIAVREERDKYVDGRFDRIEKRLDSIASLGRWALGAFGTSLVAAVVAFVTSGGLHIG